MKRFENILLVAGGEGWEEKVLNLCSVSSVAQTYHRTKHEIA